MIARSIEQTISVDAEYQVGILPSLLTLKNNKYMFSSDDASGK